MAETARELNNRIAHLVLPERMRSLPISDEGFPVPWFVPWIAGKPEFRATALDKFAYALRHKKCWLCGESLGVFQTFVIGPMCAVTRTTSEPGSHSSCAHYAVRACPFLTQPRMRRNEKNLPENDGTPGIHLDRNPGVAVLWTTKSYHLFSDGRGGVLIKVGDPKRVEWFAEGRRARRDEIMASIDSGMPLLREADGNDPEAAVMLQACYEKALAFVPAGT